MTSENAATTTATDAGADSTEVQAQEKFYSQKEFDDAMAKTRAAVERKALKPYESLGSPDELRAIKEQFENKKFEEQKGKGDYEQILKELASKKDAEIARRDAIIAQYRVDAPLTETAAKYRAVAPDQVKALLRNQIRTTVDGEVEVVDHKGTVRYNDRGEPWSVEDLVKDFLQTNPHFVQPTPATTQSRNSIATQGKQTVDPSKLDMKNPEHRAIYKEYRKANGIA